jgi:PKD repeat protein
LFVTLTDTSTGTPTSWAWDFGDASTSTLQSPTHTYAAGTYTVSLIASNASGASSPVSKIITVLSVQQSWEGSYGVSANAADADGDGLSNTNEFLAGFNPTNSAAFAHIISVTKSNAVDLNITYLGANGDTTYAGGPSARTNVLEITPGLLNGSYTNSFASTILTNILNGGTGLGTNVTVTETGGATNKPARYYRVRVLLP